MKLLSTGLVSSMILRGVQDVLIFAIDTLNGFNEAIKAVYR
jgi:transposase-like protein